MYVQQQSRITLPYPIQPTLSQEGVCLEKVSLHQSNCHIHQGNEVAGAGTYHLDTSTPSFVEPNGMGI